jgi:hypothetical protein
MQTTWSLGLTALAMVAMLGPAVAHSGFMNLEQGTVAAYPVEETQPFALLRLSSTCEGWVGVSVGHEEDGVFVVEDQFPAQLDVQGLSGACLAKERPCGYAQDPDLTLFNLRNTDLAVTLLGVYHDNHLGGAAMPLAGKLRGEHYLGYVRFTGGEC